MNVADIFRKCDGISRLQYDDFKPLNWTFNDYFHYMSFCDEIRSATIIGQYAKRAKGIKLVNGSELERSLVEQRVESLFDWLNSFSDDPLPEPKGAYTWMSVARTYDNHASYLPYNHPSPNPGFLYQSLFHFTLWIETYISKLVRDEPLVIFAQEDLSENELKKRIRKLTITIENTEPPNLPDSVDSYVRLTQWAKKQVEYDHLCDLEEQKDIYKDRLEELKVPTFCYKEATLYIYQWGNIICKRDKHNMIDVSCTIPSMEGKVTVNAQYCRDCRKYVMSRTAYEQYMQTYKMIPIRFRYMNDDGTFPQSLYTTERADHSPLSLAGYSVCKAVGYSDTARQGLLLALIDNGVLKKHEILSYLELFINTNGRSKNMNSAVEKWRKDYLFIRDYNIEKQEQHDIDYLDIY